MGQLRRDNPRVARRGRVGVALCTSFLCLWVSACAVPQPRGEGRLSRLVEPTTRRGYWLYLPKDYIAAIDAKRSPRSLPMVVTFHGMKPFDNSNMQVREWESEADRYGYIVVAPDLRSVDLLGQYPVRTVHRAFESDVEATLAILDHVASNTQADPAHVLATSFSAGGYMAHYILNRYPDRFSCLAVRQSNFSDSVLDPDLAVRSQKHPVLITETENDFAACRRDSKRALKWYQTHEYEQVTWLCVKGRGHERTPDLAADFFASVAGVALDSRSETVVSRQVLERDPSQIDLLPGRHSWAQADDLLLGVTE